MSGSARQRLAGFTVLVALVAGMTACTAASGETAPAAPPETAATEGPAPLTDEDKRTDPWAVTIVLNEFSQSVVSESYSHEDELARLAEGDKRYRELFPRSLKLVDSSLGDAEASKVIRGTLKVLSSKFDSDTLDIDPKAITFNGSDAVIKVSDVDVTVFEAMENVSSRIADSSGEIRLTKKTGVWLISEISTDGTK
jgi:hypothetical protein